MKNTFTEKQTIFTNAREHIHVCEISNNKYCTYFMRKNKWKIENYMSEFIRISECRLIICIISKFLGKINEFS